MSKDYKQVNRLQRAERLVQARKQAGFSGANAVAERFGWKIDAYKAHESGRNGFDADDAKTYAKAFGVSLTWLLYGTGSPDDKDTIPQAMVEVPLISWISAGPLGEQPAVTQFAEYPIVMADLPEGDWIALRVDGPSMNKISPPDSIIFANRRDKRLVANACYVIADETGAATYKRYRPSEYPPFQPASYEDIAAPELEGAISIIGRVKRSIIDM